MYELEKEYDYLSTQIRLLSNINPKILTLDSHLDLEECKERLETFLKIHLEFRI